MSVFEPCLQSCSKLRGLFRHLIREVACLADVVFQIVELNRIVVVKPEQLVITRAYSAGTEKYSRYRVCPLFAYVFASTANVNGTSD